MMPDAQHQDCVVADAVVDDVLAHRLGTNALAKIGSLPPCLGVFRDSVECLGECFFVHRPLLLAPIGQCIALNVAQVVPGAA